MLQPQLQSAQTSLRGNSAQSKKEKVRYFEIALNSSYELDNWLQVLKDSKAICLDKIRLPNIEKENIEVIKILTKLTNFS